WQLSESQLSKLSVRGKRAYKSIMKNRKSALAKAAEQHLPIILFVGLLLMLVVPKIKESQRRMQVDARLRKNSGAALKQGAGAHPATAVTATKTDRGN